MFYLGMFVKRVWLRLFPKPKVAAVMPQQAKAKQLFNPGRVVLTLGAYGLAMQGFLTPVTVLSRHLAGDWGGAPDSVKARNSGALRGDPKQGGVLMSTYAVPSGNRVLVVTNLGSKTTTIMLPGEHENAFRRS